MGPLTKLFHYSTAIFVTAVMCCSLFLRQQEKSTFKSHTWTSAGAAQYICNSSFKTTAVKAKGYNADGR